MALMVMSMAEIRLKVIDNNLTLHGVPSSAATTPAQS
jgi:hypothetical protein